MYSTTSMRRARQGDVSHKLEVCGMPSLARLVSVSGQWFLRLEQLLGEDQKAVDRIVEASGSCWKSAS